jgi:hypothetical protein
MKGQIITLDVFFCFLIVALMFGILYQLFLIYSNWESHLTNVYLLGSKLYTTLFILANDTYRYMCKIDKKNIPIYGCLKFDNNYKDMNSLLIGNNPMSVVVLIDGQPYFKHYPKQSYLKIEKDFEILTLPSEIKDKDDLDFNIKTLHIEVWR